MLAENVATGKFEQNIKQAIGYVQNRGFENIKARHEDFDQPAGMAMQGSDVVFTPDITAERRGARFYFEIADRTEAKEQVIGKWKLLSTLAKMKGGDFKIFVPYGSMKYATDIIEKKNIDAELIKLAK
jgi:hypothetical protein